MIRYYVFTVMGDEVGINAVDIPSDDELELSGTSQCTMCHNDVKTVKNENNVVCSSCYNGIRDMEKV